MSYPSTTTDVYTATTIGANAADGAALAVPANITALAVVDVIALVGSADVISRRIMATILRRDGGTTTVHSPQTAYSFCSDPALTDYSIELIAYTDSLVVVRCTGQAGYTIDWDTKLVVFSTDEVG